MYEGACSVHLEVGVLPVCFFLGHFGKNVQCILYRYVHQKMGLGIKSLSLDHKHEINQVLFGLTCVADALFTWLYTGII